MTVMLQRTLLLKMVGKWKGNYGQVIYKSMHNVVSVTTGWMDRGRATNVKRFGRISWLLQLLNFINQLYILFLIDNERCSIYSLFVAEEYEC